MAICYKYGYIGQSFQQNRSDNDILNVWGVLAAGEKHDDLQWTLGGATINR